MQMPVRLVIRAGLVINTQACIFKPWLCWQCLMLSSRIVLYFSLVKISVHPATVEVVKYTDALSINLYLVLMVLLLTSLKLNFFN